MEKMRCGSSELCEGKRKVIMDLFPECVREVSLHDGTIARTIDMEALKQTLGIQGPAGDEKYEFSWVGKKMLWSKRIRV